MQTQVKENCFGEQVKPEEVCLGEQYWYSLRRRESRHVFISITAGTIHSFKLVFYNFVVVKAKV